MAAFNFPDVPYLHQQVPGPGGQLYKWDGIKWVAVAGTAGGPFAPETNPSGGANNYAAIYDPAFTGAAATLNGNSLATEDWVSQMIAGLEPGGGGIGEAPLDGLQYGRQNGEWTEIIGGSGGTVGEAPMTGNLYARQDGDWSNITTEFAKYLPLTGGTLSGPLTTYSAVNLGGALNSADINLTGTLRVYNAAKILLYRDAASALEAVPLQQVQSLIAAGGGGGGIPEPSSSGNWLRTGIGTWVEGLPLTSAGALAGLNVGTGLSSGAGNLNLTNTAVTPGSYTNTNLTVDAQGRITAAVSGSAGGGGGIPEPISAGNWLRTNAGTWVEGLPLSGGILTGPIRINYSGGNFIETSDNGWGAFSVDTNANIYATGAYFWSVTFGVGWFQVDAPATFNDTLTLSGNAVSALEAVPLQQLTSTLAGYAPLDSPNFIGTRIGMNGGQWYIDSFPNSVAFGSTAVPDADAWWTISGGMISLYVSGKISANYEVTADGNRTYIGHPNDGANASHRFTGTIGNNQAVLHILPGTAGWTGDLLIATNAAGTALAKISSTGQVSGTGAFTNISSFRRHKRGIRSIEDAVERIKRLKPCSYHHTVLDVQEHGFVIEDLEEDYPEAVQHKDGKAEGYAATILLPGVVAALQEALKRIEVLEATGN